jgi:hypothetical protein
MLSPIQLAPMLLGAQMKRVVSRVTRGAGPKA